MWSGSCFTGSVQRIVQKQPSDSDQEVSPSSQRQPSGSSARGNTGTATPSRLPAIPSSSNDDGDPTTDEADEQVLSAPTPHSPCNVVISEFAVRNTLNTKSFIELQRVCPSKTDGQKIVLTGFFLIRITAGEQMHITMSIDLRNEKFKKVQERTGTGLRMSSNLYHVSGFDVPEANFDLTKAQIVTENDYQGISRAGNTANAIVLIFIPAASRITLEKEIKLPFRNGKFIPSLVTNNKEDLIKMYIQDIIVYGPPCSIDDCRLFSELLRIKPLVTPAQGTFQPIPEAQPNSMGVLQYRSINRCTSSHHPMQINDWHRGDPTPGSRNKCVDLNEQKLPFNFQGQPMQSTAQKIIVNLYTFFQKAFVDRSLYDGNPSTMISRSTTISSHTLANVMENYRSSEISTPGKRKQNPHSPVMNQFDDFHYATIRRVIQGYYSKYEPPLFNNVYEKFMQQAQAEILVRRQTDPTIRDFKCSAFTFRKVLKKIGFVFGKIGFRDAILQRPDIVKKRGEYLLALRANELSENPLPIVYTDETWVDPHARTGKGWVPRKTSGPAERLLYTYRKHKATRGPRLIVLNAGGVNGYVPGAMKVYPVKKKDVRGDYHENVDAATYTTWFMNLLNILNSIGPHIIVIDNAPYHSETLAPKEREKKGVLYKWLTENLEPEKVATLQPESRYRKWELWNMITGLKKRKSFYRIDVETEKMGHKIIRLPPYNCDLNPIELAWKDLKHELRKTNPDQNINTMQLKAEAYMNNYGTDKWRAHLGHVIALGKQYWNEDGLYDAMLDRQTELIIPLNDEDSDEEDEEAEEIREAEAYANVIRSFVHDLDDLHD